MFFCSPQPSGNEFLIWIYYKLTRISFSAWGFFPLNFKMVFGFISALITELVIFLQVLFDDGCTTEQIQDMTKTILGALQNVCN